MRAFGACLGTRIEVERCDLLDLRFHECTCITVVTCIFRDGVDLKKVFIC
jgi:hypothetical protein